MNESDQKPTPAHEPDEGTVELIGFGPTLSQQGVTPPSIADQQAMAARRRQRWILIGSVVAVAAFGFLLGPAIYRSAKAIRAASLSRSAQAEVTSQHLDEAVATIRTAYLMAPNDPEVLRGMGKTLAALQAPSAMSYWNWLLASRAATTQDRRDAAESALELGVYNQAAPIIQNLLKVDGNNAPNLLLAARYYKLAGEPQGAIDFAQRAMKSDENYQPAAIFLAIQELGTPDLHQQGIDLLLKVAEHHDAFGLLAIQRLAQETTLTPEEIQKALSQLQAFSTNSIPQKITELILQIRLTPEKREALLDQVVAAEAGASAEDQAQLAAWLNTIGEPGRTLTLISKEKALTNKELFLTRLDAMGQLKQWKEMEDLLTQNHLPLEPAYAELYLYRCAKELGDDADANLHWRSAQVAASHNPRQSLYLAGYAEQQGAPDRAEPIYRLLTKDLVAGRPAYLGLLRIDGAKETAVARELLDEMTTRWPQDEAILNDDVYFNLLLNTRVPEMYNRAVALAKADIHSAPHLTDVALAYLRLHKPKLALTIFDEGNIHWATASPSTLVVYAAALNANGKTDEARRVADRLNRDTLRPEERALLPAPSTP